MARIYQNGAASAQAAGGGAGGRGGRGGGGLGLGMGGWAKLTADLCIASLACSKIGGQLGVDCSVSRLPATGYQGNSPRIAPVGGAKQLGRVGCSSLDVPNSVERL